MNEQPFLTLLDPQNGNLAFKILAFDDSRHFDHVQRNNYYSLVWVKEGKGKVTADFAEYDFGENTLFSFSPYQAFMFAPGEMKGIAIHFHPDFFCIHKHQTEVACHGVLFNNIYLPPYTLIDQPSASSLDLLIKQMKVEMSDPALAQYEMLVSYLKILLITTSRLKASQQPAMLETENDRPFILQTLKDSIEKDFKKKHLPSQYAESLNISPKALARITKSYFNKTLTELISERIIIEAKRELYLTSKTIKEIAYELGYDDEHYFSRFFKTNADISPQLYRERVGVARGEQ